MTIKNKLITDITRELKKLELRLINMEEKKKNLIKEINSHKSALEWANKNTKDASKQK